MLPILYFTFALITLLISTYTDFKERIIPDKLTYSAIIIGILLHLFETIVAQNNSFFICISNTIIAFLFAYLLWYIGLWAGGDVKIFTAIISLTPTNFSFFNIFKFNSYFGIVSPFFFYFFIATILLMAPYSLLIAIKRTLVQKKLRNEFIQKLKNIPKMIPNLFLLSIFAVSLTILFPLYYSLIFSFLILAFAFLFPPTVKIILAIFFSIIALFFKKELFLFQTFSTFIYLTFALLFLKTLISLLSTSIKALHKKKRISQLKEGDILAKQLIFENNSYKWHSLSITNIIKYLRCRNFNRALAELNPQKIVISTNAAGLTNKQIEKLKKLAKENKIPQEVELKESAPLAQAMLLAFIILHL